MNDEPMPVIVSHQSVQPVLPKSPVVKQPSLSFNVPSSWYPPRSLEHGWTAIVIHHSATASGNATMFDKWHRENNHWDGVGYDFVVANGSDSGDGEVEVTFRWKQQRVGAHCGGTPGNWANEKGIGICLVGDFNKTQPSQRQMQSLLRLVRFLKGRYHIGLDRIYGHGTTPGARVTDCPGKNFPMSSFKSKL
ncbi:MAG: N-acetylmuramoyl-L-alanine amidase [Planctomycetes bacterium]|nr:N-acetylmuramoyl-L-alanine amidase [Planctomycetota bacterium]